MRHTQSTPKFSVAQIVAATVLMFATSACTHEQLKQEADVAAVEDTGFTGATPDVESTGTDPLAESTPIPGDSSTVASAPQRHRKVSRAHHGSPHKVKRHHATGLKKKKHKTMLAARGTVDAQLPPPPTSGADLNAIAAPELAPVPPTLPEPEAMVAPADLGGETQGGRGLVIGLTILALGALAFAGVRLRRTHASRRLVFN